MKRDERTAITVLLPLLIWGAASIVILLRANSSPLPRSMSPIFWVSLIWSVVLGMILLFRIKRLDLWQRFVVDNCNNRYIRKMFASGWFSFGVAVMLSIAATITFLSALFLCRHPGS